jgi:protein O-mannosyl-transferase
MKKQNLKYYLALAVSLTALTVYLPSLGNEFVNWDDTDLVLNNLNIRSINLPFLRWAFALQNTTSANWHPLTWISHALDYAVWGLNPLGHHLTSIILHAVNTFLVVLLVVKLIEQRLSSRVVDWSGSNNSKTQQLNSSPSLFTIQDSRFTLVAAVVTGLLFGLHPLHVEPVAWVSARADLLCALFYLLSILIYISYRSRKTYSGYIPSLLFFTLALMSKPMAVSLPLVLLLLDWYPFRKITAFKTFSTSCIGKLPFFALSLTAAIVAVMARTSAGSILEDTPLATRILVSFKAFTAYLWKMLLPLNLSSFYPYPESGASLFSLEYGSAVALVLVISTACVFLARKEKIWLAALGYYIVTLLPVIGIIRLGIPAMADRYTYLPSLGPFLIIGLLIARLSKKMHTKEQGLTVNRFGILFVFAVFLAMSFLTVKQIGVWKNGLSLWSNVIEKSPEGYFPYLNRGELLFKSGQLDEALADFDRAIAVVPSFYPLFNRLGIAYGGNGSYDKALVCFNKSLAINPNDDMAHYYRGYTYSFLNQYNRAMEDYNKAIELNQGNAQAYVQRGILHLKTGNRESAFPDFQKGCDLGDEEGCNALAGPRSGR